MRITQRQRNAIKRSVEAVFGPDAKVILFGSRLDDSRRGGDLDLLVTTHRHLEHPALDAARLSARISRELDGRKVDVLVQAPSLKTLPIHKIALETGQRL